MIKYLVRVPVVKKSRKCLMWSCSFANRWLKRSADDYVVLFSAAMSNPNGWLNQKVCCYLDQGCTSKDMLLMAGHGMPYFDLGKLNLAWPNALESFHLQPQW